jgi:uncharacterized protein
MKELVEFIVKALVDYPDRVEIAEVDGEKTTVLELRVAQEDLGKIIGRQGRTVRSIRALLTASATIKNKRVVLEILE